MTDYRSLYKEVMFLDNFTCVYCGVRQMNMQIDHYIPQCLGGPDVIQNLVAACPRCNLFKSGRTPQEAKMLARYGRFEYVSNYINSNAVKTAEFVTERIKVRMTKINDNLFNELYELTEKYDLIEKRPLPESRAEARG